jgi:hypothetical protein
MCRNKLRSIATRGSKCKSGALTAIPRFYEHPHVKAFIASDGLIAAMHGLNRHVTICHVQWNQNDNLTAYL